jgi:hypothetical protein
LTASKFDVATVVSLYMTGSCCGLEKKIKIGTAITDTIADFAWFVRP